MNHDITTNEIKRLHGLAMASAESAVEYARQAGVLLLAAKERLTHGKFLDWVATTGISARQAQRYMQAALGKPLSPRAIAKSDTVSHLPELRLGEMLHAQYWEGETLREVWVFPKLNDPGYMHIVYIAGTESQGYEAVDYAHRGIAINMVQHIPFFRDFPWQHVSQMTRAKHPGLERNPFAEVGHGS